MNSHDHATRAATLAVPAAPAGAVTVDWDHFGHPQADLARTDSVELERRLRKGALADAEAARRQLFRWSAPEASDDRLRAHYAALPGWRMATPWSTRPAGSQWAVLMPVETDDAPARALLVLWIPAVPPSHDGLLMQVELRGR